LAGAARLLVGTQLGCRDQPWYNRVTPEFARGRDIDMAAVATPLDDLFKECRDMDASLAERLASFAAAVHSRLPSFAAAVDRLVKRLSENGAGDAAPREGDPMPPFLLPDETNRLISLEQMLQTGSVAVTFHRGHWCPYCRINVNALARANETISPEGGQIVAIVPERQQYAMEFKADGQAEFPILTDLDNGYAMSLNLAVWVGEELRQVMRDQLSHDIASFQGNESWILPIPATFVVGRDGLVQARFVDPDYRKRMAIEDLIAALRKEM
jgi:peroxiredoxin